MIIVNKENDVIIANEPDGSGTIENNAILVKDKDGNELYYCAVMPVQDMSIINVNAPIDYESGKYKYVNNEFILNEEY